MTRRLILLRHGQTEWNAISRAQGHADIDLDEVGRAQATAVAPTMRAYRPVRLWSSDLQRAVRTAEVVSAEVGLPVTLDPRLREYDLGDRQGLTTTEFSEKFPAEYDAWVHGREQPAVPGAEVSADVQARVRPALRECLDALADGETGIVVTHGGTLKVAVMDLLGWPWAMAATLRGVDNCAWVEVSTDQTGRLRLVRYNATHSSLPDPS